MGIPKLTTYMRSNGNFSPVILSQVALRALVIDGFALCYVLHSQFMCGDYCEFYSGIVRFFNDLKKIGIEAYVVVDGTFQEKKKEDTSVDRILRRLKLLQEISFQHEKLIGCVSFLPTTARIVFVDALRENGVKFFVADGEADRDIASLANFLCCPVFSNDSDFFIHKIEHGVILVPNNLDGIFADKKLEVYSYQSFLKRCNFTNPQVLLFLPYCLGNDFYERHELKELEISKDGDVRVVVEKLGMRPISTEKYHQELYSYCELYDVALQSFKYLSDPGNSMCNNEFIPSWIVSNYKKGLLSPNAMCFLVTKVWKYVLLFENLENESAWKVSGSVLLYIIGALLSSCDQSTISSAVVITRRPIVSLERTEVVGDSLKQRHFDILCLSNIIDITELERRKIILRVFHCKHIPLESVPDCFKLVVIASRCWITSISQKINEHFVVALVLCFHACFHGACFERCDLQTASNIELTQLIAHWEGMVYLANIFNQILGVPFVYASLGRLFSITRFLGYLERPSLTIPSSLDDTGKLMYNAIVKDFYPVLLLRPSQTVSRQQEIATENKYAPLATLSTKKIEQQRYVIAFLVC